MVKLPFRGYTASTPPQYHCHYCISPTWTPELIHRTVSFPAIAVAGVDTCVVFGWEKYLDGTLVEALQKLSGYKLMSNYSSDV